MGNERRTLTDDKSVERPLQIGGQGEDVGVDLVVSQALDEKFDRGNVGAIRDVGGSISASENPANSSLPSRTTDPESPRWENGPDLELRGNTLTSFDISPGLPSKYSRTKARMVFRRPTVRSEVFPFFSTMMTGSLSWSLFFGLGLNISWSETVPVNRRRRLVGYLNEVGLAGHIQAVSSSTSTEPDVDGVADEVELRDHRGFDLDHSPVVGEALVAVVNNDGGRQGNVADNAILFHRPIPGDVGEQLFGGCDRFLRLLDFGLYLLPLCGSLLLVLHPVSIRQTTLEVLEDELLDPNRGPDGLATSLEGRLPHEHDLLLGLTGAFAEGVELVLVVVGVEEDVPRREKVEDTWFGSVDEEASGTLEIGGRGVTDGNTESSGEGLADDGDGVGSDGGLVQ